MQSLIKLPILGVLSMNRSKMTKNFVFREFECGLSIEEAA
ncbi:regulator, partial [Vibrio mimicus]